MISSPSFYPSFYNFSNEYCSFPLATNKNKIKIINGAITNNTVVIFRVFIIKELSFNFCMHSNVLSPPRLIYKPNSELGREKGQEQHPPTGNMAFVVV
jgi:hypothetical protein